MAKKPPKVSVRNLNFYYANQALFDNTLDIVDNQVTAIIGPSGCGKSTHIRVYNRIFELYRDQRAEGSHPGRREHPQARRGRDRAAPAGRHDLPEAHAVPDDHFENVAYGLRMHFSISRNELAERVEGALRQAALWDEVKDQLDQPGMALSGGQQQRLCIARAIAVEPEVILMDEPTAAIDPIATAKIEDLIEELKEKYTIVIVTHNMQQAARVSDFTAFFYQGRIVEFGPTEMIFTKPAMKQTEDYVTGRFG